MRYNREQEERSIAHWVDLIGQFNKLIEGSPSPSKIEKELRALKEEAKNDNALTQRQTEAIIARCNNYLIGTYGTKLNVKFQAA